MVAVLSVTEGKNKVIVSGLVGASSTLVFLTVIHIAAKIAIVVTAAAVTYALLSLIHKVKARSAKTHGISKDEGYESEEKDTVEEPEKTEAELEEELKNKRAQERMEKRLLGGPINAFGEPILDEIKNTECSHSVNYTKTMAVPDKIVLGEPDNKTFAQNNSSSVKNQMRSLPERIDVFGNQVFGQSTGNLTNNTGLRSQSTQKPSPSDLLLQYGNVDNDVRRVLEQSITQKGFNGLGFDR
ncbi:hypothetical protein Wcon_00092 [Wolbachia endosymbiont of Cylisticus convexus]|uniref:hypothetical protein n=1 Tax=Wolbachia endosymbiont of Cylisticus convexus TaxID=118728 RepID=UPI000DF6FE5F|nr:hypothetical protein [Wolbachia endosymbiont of Cylisticus convexus]RDD35679.1 hypothetical protein Wcon_00092 [Wolbachia endosymbiont of Cylisticus convexus]